MIPPAGGFRLPDSTRVGEVHLQVSDLSRALEYYEGLLGLEVRSNDGASAGLGAADGPALVVLHEQRGLRPAPRRGAYGLYHFAILVPDRAALGRFATHLSRLNVQVGMADHRVSEALYLTDPDGLGIEVYADRPRSTWESRGEELLMTSDPLDVRSVMHAGAASVWDGMPAGTTMGHMHLHVGDLARAEAFYHQALGLDKVVWSYSGALFMSAGGYHHHLAVNTWSPGPSAREEEARLREWQLIVPTNEDVSAIAARMNGVGVQADRTDNGCVLIDPWGTRMLVTASPPESSLPR
jgi:catechol 2,3-dioxygenase